MVKRGLIHAVLSLLLCAAAAGAAEAATFVVNSTAHTLDQVCDSNCTLGDAIYEANQNGASSPDDIVLDCVTYTADGNPQSTGIGSGNAYPTITTPIRIHGNGATIERSSTAPLFRFFLVSGVSLTIENLTLRNGQSGYYGGAIYNDRGELTVQSSVLENNTAGTSPSYWLGGAIASHDGGLYIDHSTLRNNRAQRGGAIFSDVGFGRNANLIITQSSIVQNQALTNSGIGGGIAMYGEGVLSGFLRDTTVSSNAARAGGGLAFYTLQEPAAPFQLINVTVTGNTGEGGGSSLGGGIYAYT